jgi:hypothetical protein
MENDSISLFNVIHYPQNKMFSTGDLTDLNNASYFNIQYLQMGQFDGNSMVLLRKSTLKEPLSINDPER